MRRSVNDLLRYGAEKKETRDQKAYIKEAVKLEIEEHMKSVPIVS